MSWKNRFEPAKAKLLADEQICEANRNLFAEFFRFEEYKLKRKNGLASLDEPSYKTLYEYVRLFRNVNQWFGNKPWHDLGKEDIKRVYDDLEDGRIKNEAGQPIKDKASYYNKVLRSKPFGIAGKAELAREVIEFYNARSDNEVRFVTQETFLTIVDVVSSPVHLLLFWLAWDLGENVDALLKLTPRDFTRQLNTQTKEPEYLVHLSREKLKRSRTARTEPTLYAETVRYADIVLRKRSADEPLFGIGYAQARKLLRQAVFKVGAACQPTNDPVRWKDLRSGMACHLLRTGWSREEVDARLGHTPNSRALNAYINYLALDRVRPKKKLFNFSLEQLQDQIEESRQREKLTAQRLHRVQEDNRFLLSEITQIKRLILEGKHAVQPDKAHRKTVQ